MARVVQDRVCAHATSGRCATAAGLWPRTMMMGTVLAILVCLTTWALASVAPWMTPVYLALMVLIFVTPRNQHQLSLLSNRSANPLANEERDRKQEPSMEGTGEVAIVRLTGQLVGGSTANQLTLDPTGSIPDSVGGNAVKQWRGRTRTRKTSRSAAEAASGTPPVAWIRVGPGKFVRADSKTPAIAQVQSLGSGNEEHGIAPSALGPPHTSSAPPDCAGDKVSGVLVDATFEPNPVAGLTEKALDCDSGFERPRLQHAWSRAKSNRVLRGFAGAILAADRARAAVQRWNWLQSPNLALVPDQAQPPSATVGAACLGARFAASARITVRAHRLTHPQRISMASP